jgi:hypothetical protein
MTKKDKQVEWLPEGWTVRDVAEKIDYEGGPCEYFLYYDDGDWKGAPFEHELKAFRKAWETLHELLEQENLLL